MTLESTTQVRKIAAEYPLATRVFHRREIDFCCRGGQSLADACSDLGLDPSEVLGEIEAELQSSADDETRWDLAPIPDLVTHIVNTYHESLREELPRLDAMAKKVNEVHGSKMPEVLGGIVTVFGELREELESHMMKEEQELFPSILAGKSGSAIGPVEELEDEHRDAGNALTRLRQLANNYEVPRGACHTWTALWHGLAALERDLHQHIHLENNILFPRRWLSRVGSIGGWRFRSLLVIFAMKKYVVLASVTQQ